jgi:hypothetical protein
MKKNFLLMILLITASCSSIVTSATYDSQTPVPFDTETSKPIQLTSTFTFTVPPPTETPTPTPVRLEDLEPGEFTQIEVVSSKGNEIVSGSFSPHVVNGSLNHGIPL